MPMTCASAVLVRVLDNELGKHEGSSGWMVWRCPFCPTRKGSESNKLRLRVNVAEGGGAICYRCQFKVNNGRNLLAAIADTTGNRIDLSNFEDAVAPRLAANESLYSSVLSTLYPADEADATKRPRPLPEEMIPIEKCHKYRLARRALVYLEDRGVTVEEAKIHEVGFCPTGEFAQRLIFPIRMFGKVVYHTNRYCGDHDLKSKNPKNREGFYKATDCLGNFDRALCSREVFVLEGPFDRFSRPDDGVFTMGKRISDEQVALLEYMEERGTEEFVILRDSDADAFETYTRCAGRLKNVTQVVLKKGDPFSRRRVLDKLIKRRTTPSVFDSVRRRLGMFVV